MTCSNYSIVTVCIFTCYKVFQICSQILMNLNTVSKWSKLIMIGAINPKYWSIFSTPHKKQFSGLISQAYMHVSMYHYEYRNLGLQLGFHSWSITKIKYMQKSQIPGRPVISSLPVFWKYTFGTDEFNTECDVKLKYGCEKQCIYHNRERKWHTI